MKIRTFTYLELCSHYPLPWRSANGIKRVIGSKSSSLYVLLNRWVTWGYLIRQNYMKRYHGKPVFMYSITEKGINYLNNLPKWYEGDYQAIQTEVRSKAIDIDSFLMNKIALDNST